MKIIDQLTIFTAYSIGKFLYINKPVSQLQPEVMSNELDVTTQKKKLQEKTIKECKINKIVPHPETTPYEASSNMAIIKNPVDRGLPLFMSLNKLVDNNNTQVYIPKSEKELLGNSPFA